MRETFGDLFLILNLKRIFSKNRLIFWNKNQYGYTDNIGEAGIFISNEIIGINLDDDDVLININEDNFLNITKEDIENAKKLNRNSCISTIIDLDSNVNNKAIIDIIREKFEDKL